jgi:hypothetical protein
MAHEQRVRWCEGRLAAETAFRAEAKEARALLVEPLSGRLVCEEATHLATSLDLRSQSPSTPLRLVTNWRLCSR